jgi:hypothetical protein
MQSLHSFPMLWMVYDANNLSFWFLCFRLDCQHFTFGTTNLSSETSDYILQGDTLGNTSQGTLSHSSMAHDLGDREAMMHSGRGSWRIAEHPSSRGHI